MPEPQHSVDPLSDDALTADFRVWQRRRGHRYSLDDVLTAWDAAQAMLERRIGPTFRGLDLGCGIGSVVLMLAWRFPQARFRGVEAQAVSFALAERNVRRNRVEERVELRQGDLREPAVVGEASFDLVTGTPPYFPVGEATPSTDPQRARARIEYLGGVEDYLQSAGRVLRPGGVVVLCADVRRPERVLAGAKRADLVALQRRDVVARRGQARALFSIWLFHRPSDIDDQGGIRIAPVFYARDKAGGRTPEIRQVREFFGLPISTTERPSP
ncbi:MAG: methyltransferase domain-containing protein [Myxococcota bacterium]